MLKSKSKRMVPGEDGDGADWRRKKSDCTPRLHSGFAHPIESRTYSNTSVKKQMEKRVELLRESWHERQELYFRSAPHSTHRRLIPLVSSPLQSR